jgi:hypothetical protein
MMVKHELDLKKIRSQRAMSYTSATERLRAGITRFLDTAHVSVFYEPRKSLASLPASVNNSCAGQGRILGGGISEGIRVICLKNTSLPITLIIAQFSTNAGGCKCELEGVMKYQHKFTWLGIGTAAAMFVMTGVASAVTSLTLSGPILGNTVGPQSTSNPCIIAGTQCQQPAGFGFNNFTSSGAISSYNMYSTTPTANVADGVQGTPYTVAQLQALGSNTFLIAIDVNTTGAATETLQLFEIIINGVVAYNYIGPTVIGGVANNGNGFGDWTLGVLDTNGLSPNTTVLFHAVWNNAVDGAESLLLFVPGPILGAGLPGVIAACVGLIGLARRRRRLQFA